MPQKIQLLQSQLSDSSTIWNKAVLGPQNSLLSPLLLVYYHPATTININSMSPTGKRTFSFIPDVGGSSSSRAVGDDSIDSSRSIVVGCLLSAFGASACTEDDDLIKICFCRVRRPMAKGVSR